MDHPCVRRSGARGPVRSAAAGLVVTLEHSKSSTLTSVTTSSRDGTATSVLWSHDLEGTVAVLRGATDAAYSAVLTESSSAAKDPHPAVVRVLQVQGRASQELRQRDVELGG